MQTIKKISLELAAAVTFFTRIPVWKLVEIPSESFKKMIAFWPLTGWITAGLTALVWCGFSALLPPWVAVVLTFAFRVLLTGGLHEDGLSDFFDGFGGGRTKEDVLRIMKDSHTGSYALVGMIFYFLLLVGIVSEFPTRFVTVALLAADPFSKMLSALIINLLPYARTEQESKSKMLFQKAGAFKLVVLLVGGLLPSVIFLDKSLWLSLIFPIFVFVTLSFATKKKIGGYTGDVCGAIALLCELSVFLSLYVALFSI